MSAQIIFEKLLHILLCVGPLVGCFVLGTYFIRQWAKTTTTTTSQPLLSPLQELNKEFRRQYIKARDSFWRSVTDNGTVIIGNGSSLTLIHNGFRQSVPKAIPQIYHDLKSIAHIPLTIYIALSNNSSTSTDGILEQYWQHLINLQIPDSIGLNEQPSVNRIISASQRLLQKEMNNKGSVNGNELTQFCGDLASDLGVLLNAAAIAQLDTMHKIIQDWMNEHNINRESPSFKVLLIGARTARRHNLQATYFEHLFGIERKRNIAYIEELFDNELKATSVFSTWFFDEQMSVAFFKDQDRMHHDLLMNEHVRQYIEQLIPQ